MESPGFDPQGGGTSTWDRDECTAFALQTAKLLCTVEALLTDGLISRRLYLLPTLQNPFLSTAIQTMYFYTSVSSQLQLRTHFSSPDSVHLLELPLEFGLCNVFSPIEEVEAVSSITLLYLMQNTIIHIQDAQ